MKSLVSLVVHAVVVFLWWNCYGGKHRGKCVKKGRTRATKDTCEDSRSMVFGHSRLGRTAGLERVLLSAFITEKKRLL